MKRQWIKLYLEIMDDAKMGRLSDHLWRRTVEFFLLAGENDKDGLLPPVDDMAWRLRTSADDLTMDLNAMRGVVVEPTPEGWFVTKFKDRQYSESYERVKRYRNAKSNDDGNAVVAEKQSTSTSILISSPSSSGGEGMGEGEVFRVFEQNIGLLTPKAADSLKADIDEYNRDWVLAAIEYAVKQEKRNLAYIEGTLKGWKRDGLQLPPKNGNKPQKKSDTSLDAKIALLRNKVDVEEVVL